MKLIGQFSRSFSNFITLRGIANIKYLEKISFADRGYQRDLFKQHGKAMVNFLNKGEYTFFPELIFSVSLDNESGSFSKVASGFYSSIPGQSVKNTRYNGFKLKATTQKLKNADDSRNMIPFCRGEFESTENTPILQRIDGNHRLSSAESLERDLLVPFCIIFYIDKLKTDKFNRVLFNNINYKSLPLTAEENLRLIFEKKNGEYLFSDEELKDPVWFGKRYIQARHCYSKLDLANLDIIESILKKDEKDIYTRTMLLEFSTILNKEVPDKKLKKALQETNECYRTYQQNSGHEFSYSLITVHLYYYFQNKIQIFSKWVKDNHIYELQKVDAQGLIDLFNKVAEAKRRTIFLAMSFDDAAKQNHDAIKSAIDEINQNGCTDLKLDLLRVDEKKPGYSFTITDEILKSIEEGGYLIADISLANPNVYYELGYQMGINRGKDKKQDNFLIIHNEGVAGAKFDKDKSFNISHINIERAKESNGLREKVREQLKKYYGLKND